ncbi:hypothetical protein AGLY_004157 [Aphis glycines]|uniref:Uncharacterized protein n=1 Tax=Aphis glycines TaxID=307491 RepID=A0A6G0TXA2_APHGL|nr:hypothetical protein AGLY_004157 [Aphis glycines]
MLTSIKTIMAPTTQSVLLSLYNIQYAQCCYTAQKETTTATVRSRCTGNTRFSKVAVVEHPTQELRYANTLPIIVTIIIVIVIDVQRRSIGVSASASTGFQSLTRYVVSIDELTAISTILPSRSIRDRVRRNNVYDSSGYSSSGVTVGYDYPSGRKQHTATASTRASLAICLPSQTRDLRVGKCTRGSVYEFCGDEHDLFGRTE